MIDEFRIAKAARDSGAAESAPLSSYELHPVTGDYAEFTAEEWQALTADIQANGVRVPLVIWRNMIVDGRHRYRILKSLGIAIPFRDITAECPTEESMRAHVRSLNEHRRARTRPMTNEEKRMRVDRMLNPEMPVGNLPTGIAEQSDRAIAKACGVSHHTVSARRKANGSYTHTPHEEKERKRRQVIEALLAAPWSKVNDLAKQFHVRARFISTVKSELVAVGQLAPGRAPLNPPPPASVDVKKKRSVGYSLQLKPDETPESVCRVALQLLREGAKGTSVDSVAEVAGIGVKSFRQVRDIVLLSDRTDLSNSEAARVKAALDQLNRTRQPEAAYALVRDIAQRVWGRAPRRNKSETKRVEAFSISVGVISSACKCADDINIPHLNDKTAREAIRDVQESIDALRRFNVRIKGRTSE